MSGSKSYLCVFVRTSVGVDEQCLDSMVCETHNLRRKAWNFVTNILDRDPVAVGIRGWLLLFDNGESAGRLL